MKKIRIIGMLLLAIIMGVSFTSCNPDNKQEEATKKLVKIRYINDEKISPCHGAGREKWVFITKHLIFANVCLHYRYYFIPSTGSSFSEDGPDASVVGVMVTSLPA